MPDQQQEAERITLTGVVKSVNQKNTGFTLEDNPQQWLNYSQHRPISTKPNRRDKVRVVVNGNFWIQSVEILEAAAPAPGQPGPNGRAPAGAPRGEAGEGYRRPTDESLSIGRQSALKSAVELCGYMPTIEPTEDDALARAKIIVAVAIEFSKFVNEPIARSAAARAGRAPEAATGSPAPATASGTSATPDAPSAPVVPSTAKPPDTVFCARDGKAIEQGINFTGGEIWDAARMIGYTRETYGEPLCSTHFAGELKKQREQAAEAARAAGVTQGVPA